MIVVTARSIEAVSKICSRVRRTLGLSAKVKGLGGVRQPSRPPSLDGLLDTHPRLARGRPLRNVTGT
jgi:hypothetical protein